MHRQTTGYEFDLVWFAKYDLMCSKFSTICSFSLILCVMKNVYVVVVLFNLNCWARMST